MTLVAEAKDKDLFLRHVESFDRSAAPRYAPLRDAARLRFRALPLPGRRTEDWRFTSVQPLVRVPFELAGPAQVAAKALPPLPTPDTLRLVFVNGRFAREHSRLSGIPAGVTVASLADAPADAVRPYLAEVADHGEQVFTALNTSFLADGACVLVPDGVSLSAPVEIVHVSAPGLVPTVSHPRVLLVFGKQAQATVVERYLATDAAAYFTNAVTEIVVGARAVIDHYKVQHEAAQAFHIASTQVLVAGRSVFSTHYLGFGGQLIRNEVGVRFTGENAEATVNGLYLAAGRQHHDNQTVIDHALPKCASHELYKGILADRSHGVFNGKIFVRKDAQKTDAKQTNKVLLLSDDATINTKPQLEIFADDVKCTHGATVGQLDDEQLYYLRSRGIGAEAARALLTFAFANDIVRRVKIEALRDELEALIVRK